MHTLTDDQLIQLLKKDSRAAFTEIYHRYGRDLAAYAAAGSRLGDSDAAGDVLHDVYTWLWEERQHFKINNNLKAYLFRAVRNQVIDHIRKNKTRQQYADLLQELAERYAESPLQQLKAKDLSRIVTVSLQKLSPRVRQVYELSRNEQLTIREIALQLNVSEQTVKNQLTTALNHLRKTVPTSLMIGCWLAAGAWA